MEPAQLAEQDKLYGLVGKALSQWADLELKFHLLAIRCWQDSEIEQVSELIDAVIAFEAKLKLVGLLVKRYSKDKGAIKIWPYMVSWILKLKKKRDRIAHGIVTHDKYSNRVVVLPYISFANLDRDSFNGAMTEHDIQTHISLFEEAAFLVLEFSMVVLGKESLPQDIDARAQQRLLSFRVKAGLTQEGSQSPPQSSQA
ncbi:MAG: hypothetical protein WAT78_00550 [Rhizobiaceae bacterium]